MHTSAACVGVLEYGAGCTMDFSLPMWHYVISLWNNKMNGEVPEGVSGRFQMRNNSGINLMSSVGITSSRITLASHNAQWESI
jgi:hypothetical protein